MICYILLAWTLFQTADFARPYWQVWNRVLLAVQKWREQNTSPRVGLRHTVVLILNFSLIRRSKSQLITGIF